MRERAHLHTLEPGISSDALGDRTSLPVLRSSNDDATDRQLRLLIGLVVVLALGAIGLNLWFALLDPPPMPNVLLLFLLYLGSAVANRVKVYVRVQSSRNATTWGEIPNLVGLILLPTPWMVLCAAAGLATVKILARITPHKALYSVAKEVLVVSAAGAAMSLTGVHPGFDHPQAPIAAVIVGYLVLWFVDDLLFHPIIAIASHSTIRKVLRQDLKGRLIAHAARLATAIYVIEVLVTGVLPSGYGKPVPVRGRTRSASSGC